MAVGGRTPPWKTQGLPHSSGKEGKVRLVVQGLGSRVEGLRVQGFGILGFRGFGFSWPGAGPLGAVKGM